ncbi:MAG: efflux RND transporter permease subunit, partial [Pseudomonadota bacterium]|nr:efflux RND transporter permease subunit [Pseudomonadota bacterium]
ARLNLPGVTNAFVMPIKTRIDMLATGIKTPVGIKISGPDLDIIQRVGADIETALADVPGTVSAFAERVVGGRYLTVDIDRVAAARLGLNIADVQEVVRTAVGGMNVTQTVEGLERYPVNLRYPQSVRDSLDRLRLLPVITPTGAQVPLIDVARVSVEEGPAVIKTEDARPTGLVFVDIAGRDLGSYVTAAQQRVAERVDLPAGYAIEWSGQFEYLQRAVERLTVVVPATLVIIVLLLYLAFRSLFEVVAILFTLPLALVGGVWLLYLLDYNLSIAVGVGFIALAGVAVEIGVVMLTYLNQALATRRKEVEQAGGILTGQDIRHAVVSGALLRVRPIMMTVAAIVAGLLPIMLGGGTGSEVMRRIAAPMVGGMVSATLLTLAVIPALFFVWHRGRAGATPGRAETGAH